MNLYQSLLMLAVLFGCAAAPSKLSPAPEITDYPQRQISQCGYPNPAVERLATAEQWQQWAVQHKVRLGLFAEESWPNSEQRFVIAAGSQPSAGYRVVFDGVADRQLAATVELIGDGDPQYVYAQVITSPCVVVQLPAGDYRAVLLHSGRGGDGLILPLGE